MKAVILSKIAGVDGKIIYQHTSGLKEI